MSPRSRRPSISCSRHSDPPVDDNVSVAVADGAARRALQEVSRPDEADTGRLRLVDYPTIEGELGAVARMQLDMHEHRDAVALPLTKIQGTGRKVGTVYSRDGRPVRDSERAIGPRRGHWHANKRIAPEALPDPTVALPGRSFFLGHWSPGFGHVLLELLPRLWPSQDYGRYDHFVLYPRRRDKTPALEPATWLRELLGLCGIPLEKVVVLRGDPVGFELIDVTTPPFVMKSVADVRFLDVFARITERVLASPAATGDRELPKRIYLSRSQVSTRSANNEEQLEAVMRRWGFVVLHPQQMTIIEQVEILAQVEVIAGCDGSALHTAVFARPGTKLLALDSRVVPSQFVIDRARGLDAVHVLAPDKVASRRAKWTAEVGQVEATLELLLPTAS